MAGRRGDTTKTLDDECVSDKEWRKLYDDDDDVDETDDNDVFVDRFTDDDVNSMLSGVERSASTRGIHTHAKRDHRYIRLNIL